MRSVVLAVSALALTGGCVAVKHQITDPNVAARFDSTKSPDEFARCAADKLTPPFKLEQNGQTFALTLQRDIRLVSRWDFFPTNNGSQAELRNGARDDAGTAEVRACA